MYFVFSFVDDWVTRGAGVWQWAIHALSSQTRTYRITATGAPAIRMMVDTILSDLGPNGVISGIEITGHGLPGDIYGRLSLADLQNSSSQQQQDLQKLRARWHMRNKGMILRNCFCAAGPEGQRFLALFAKTVGAKVYAWDQAYEIVPNGVQYAGYPDGATAMVYDTGRTHIFGRAGLNMTIDPRHPIHYVVGGVRATWRLTYNTLHYLLHGRR
jgi:hypothetical protein